MAKIVNREQLEENRKSQQELVRWIYPDYLSGEEWEKLRKEYLKWLDTGFCSITDAEILPDTEFSKAK